MTLKVNGELIDESEILQEAERMRERYEQTFAEMEDKARDDQLLEWSRENVIERVLMRQEAGRQTDSIPAEKIEAALEQIKSQHGGDEDMDEQAQEKLRSEIELQFRINQLVAGVTKGIGKPSNEQFVEYYQQNKEQFKTTEMVRVAHIVKHVNWQRSEQAAREAIEKAGSEIAAGAVFEQLVGRYSDCPENGGDLGYVVRGQMVEEFEDVVFNLDAGQVSDVFRTRFGFHIAKVYDRKQPVIKELDDVREQIIAELTEQNKREAVDVFVDKLKGKATIEVA